MSNFPASNSPLPGAWLSPAQYARRCVERGISITDRTVRNMIADGRLPEAIPVGAGRWVIPETTPLPAMGWEYRSRGVEVAQKEEALG